MTKDALIGHQLDEYRLEELLGQGGMARVYRGFDVRLKRWVAIKVIDTPFRADSDYIARFEREAQAIVQLEHPHIVSVYRYGEVDGILYIAMQYIEGASLETILSRYRANNDFIPSAEIRQIIRQIGLALDYAHGKGVIHRDIKPANIMLDSQGNAILTDFGLALLTEEGTRGEIFGTPHYIAPEQAMSSAAAVPQSDLYAMGVILYEMFSGEVPFDAPDSMDVAMLHMAEPPPPPTTLRPDISAQVEAVILKTLEKEPADRYPSGSALVDALEKALNVRRITTSYALDAPPATVAQLVADGLQERPLPPLPAGAAVVAGPSTPPPTTVLAGPAPAGSQQTNPLLYVGLGLAGVLLLGLLAAFFIFRSADGSTGEVEESAVTRPTQAVAVQETPTLSPQPTGPPDETLTPSPQPTRSLATAEESTASANAESGVAITPPTVTPSPSNPTFTPAPTLSPTATPSPEPQLIADTWEPDGNWEYLSSSLWQFDWRPMSFRAGQFGSCWYGPEEYIRICGEISHPGPNTDLAWRWTSPISGTLQVVITAAKEKAGGDGLLLYAYNNSPGAREARIFEGFLGQNNTAGLTESFQVEGIAPGDYLLFTMHMNETPIEDATYYRIRICQNSCPES